MKLKATLLLAVLLSTNLIYGQQTLYETLFHDGMNREYIIYIPAAYNGSEAVPLLFNFHGFTSSAQEQMIYVADMRPIADTANFFLVYPQGSEYQGYTHWNVGAWTAGSPADDVGFTSAMIDTLAAVYNIDTERVYSSGFSNGGAFSFELACKLSDRIAAVGEVSGPMTNYTLSGCNADHPTPLLTIHGTADGVVDYYGTYPAGCMSQEDIIDYWTSFNNTSTVPVVTNLPDINPNDGSTVELYQYVDGDNCVSFDHYKVIGGGHTWPGTYGNMDIHASSEIWNFVSKYDINGLIGCSISSIPVTASDQIISAYPNPTTGKLYVELKTAGSKNYEIYSTMGEIVSSGSISSGYTSIDLSNLPSNIYLLKVDGSITKILKSE